MGDAIDDDVVDLISVDNGNEDQLSSDGKDEAEGEEEVDKDGEAQEQDEVNIPGMGDAIDDDVVDLMSVDNGNEDQLSSDGKGEEEVDKDPPWVDIGDGHEMRTIPTELLHSASISFVNLKGMSPIESISELGVVVDVLGDGNCFFYAIMVGLHFLHIAPYYLHSGTNQERISTICSLLRSVTIFRKAMFLSLFDNIEQFRSNDSSIRSVHDSCGDRLSPFSGSVHAITAQNASPGAILYQDKMDYDKGCSRAHWADISFHLPIAAFKHQITIVIYSTIEGRIRTTEIAAYFDGSVTRHHLPGHWYSPPPNVRSILIFHTGNHFQFILPEHYTGDRNNLDFPTFLSVSDSTVGKVDFLMEPCKQEASSFENNRHISRPTTSCLNDVSRVLSGKAPWSSYEHFCGVEKVKVGILQISHIRFTKFQNSKFSVQIPSIELAGKIIVSHDAEKLLSAIWVPKFKAGAWFRSQIVKARDFPPHVSLRCQGATASKVGITGAGKRVGTHNYILKVNGWCSGTKNGRGKKIVGETDGCSTKWIGGIDYPNLLRHALNPTDAMIELQITINGACFHPEKKMMGQLRGQERDQAVEDVSMSSLFL